MLVLSRKVEEKLKIGNDIIVTVVSISQGQVKLGIEAPDDVNVVRDEIDRKAQLKSVSFLRD